MPGNKAPTVEDVIKSIEELNNFTGGDQKDSDEAVRLFQSVGKQISSDFVKSAASKRYRRQEPLSPEALKKFNAFLKFVRKQK